MAQLPLTFREQTEAAVARARAAQQGAAQQSAQTEAKKPDPAQEGPRVFTVSELQRTLRGEVEQSHPVIHVSGEISNFTVHSVSGHGYFTLKDDGAQLRCVMWHDNLIRLRFRLRDGLQVVVRGKLTVYEKSGQLQLSAVFAEPKGLGALQEAYRALAEKLRAEGLTRPERKRPLPFFPRCIGIVTSRNAAALRDVIRTARRRDPELRILISPASVQGEGAASDIAKAIARLDAFGKAELILVVRGGGSVEDLWSFNEEAVARAIVKCSVPVVTGIGHETDRTIADLVSDLSASTPTAAAERAIPVRADLIARMADLRARLDRSLTRRAQHDAKRLAMIEARLRDPKPMLERRAQRLDELVSRAERLLRKRIREGTRTVDRLSARVEKHEPRKELRAIATRLAVLEAKQRAATRRIVESAERRQAIAIGRLEALSPVKILARGYALVSGEAGALLRRAEDARVGERLEVRLSEGKLAAEVLAVFTPEPRKP